MIKYETTVVLYNCNCFEARATGGDISIRNRVCWMEGADTFMVLPTGALPNLFLKMGQPWPLLLFIFGLFKQTSLQFLQQIQVKKCPSSR